MENQEQELAQNYVNAISPASDQKVVDESKLDELFDIDDDGDFDLVDMAIIAGLMVAGYVAIKFVRGK